MGDPAVSSSKGRMERRFTNSRTIHGPASRAVGDEHGAHERYRRAKETERGETEGGESERLIVPRSRGNRPERTPGREGGAVSQTVGGKHGGDIEP